MPLDEFTIAIDPGVRETGVVVLEGIFVRRAFTVRYKEPAETQAEIQAMCNDICSRLRSYVSGYKTPTVVIEGFVYLHNRFKADSLKTVFLVGALMREFPNAVIQTSADVLNPNKPGNRAYLKDPENAGMWPGAEMCTNEHERSALAHAAYYISRDWGDSCER